MAELHCECCERKLNVDRTTWLEKSWKSNRWYLAGKCPQDESQGHFPFGKACARKTLKDQMPLPPPPEG